MTIIDVYVPPAVAAAGETGPCDFSGDGRRDTAVARCRSALACPDFYLAIPVCALLFLAVGIIRLCGRLRRALVAHRHHHRPGRSDREAGSAVPTV
jgi:hypothetical protein